MPNITCGSCKARHSSVSDVRACYDRKYRATETPVFALTAPVLPAPAPATLSVQPAEKPVTDYTVKEITRLWGKIDSGIAIKNKQVDNDVIDDAYETVFRRVANITQSRGEFLVEELKNLIEIQRAERFSSIVGITKEADTLPMPPKTSAAKPQVEPGLYHHEDGVARVKTTKNGRTVAGYLVAGRFSYQKGLVYKIDPTKKVTESEAAAYGHETGNCMCCGRTLTNPASIALGIGPICRDKWF